MADEPLRILERSLAVGGITQEEFNQALCRFGRCEWVAVLRVAPSTLPGALDVRICKRCLELKLDWDRPVDLARCELCLSPVLMRLAGVCLDCGHKMTMPRGGEPPKRGHAMTGRTASGMATHAAVHLPPRNSKSRIVSICGPRLSRDSLVVGRPTCKVCLKRLDSARRRQKTAREQQGGTST